MPDPFAVAVVMERRSLANRWQSEAWRVARVVRDEGGASTTSRLPSGEASLARWLHRGFIVVLHRDEAEGYYLNLSTDQPVIFVMWRLEEGIGVPKTVTVSYNEAARMMDGGEQVDAVPLLPEMAVGLAEFTQEHFKPEPKKRARPPSFRGARRDE